MSNTIFGPQGGNATSVLPAGSASNRYGTGVHTWAQDCGANGANGTILNAAFFNNIIGNLRNLVTGAVADGATLTVSDGNMDAVLDAVKFYAGSGVTAGDGLKFVGNALTIDVPTLKVMIA